LTYVIDTSALMRFFIPDGPLPVGLEPALRNAAKGEASLIAPELILAESGQVLHKKRRQKLLEADELDALLDSLLDLPIQLYGHRNLLRSACALAAESGLTVYDALFLALAIRYNASLITADDVLRRAADQLDL
jgi:predicted nucleic acid-binding protein